MKICHVLNPSLTKITNQNVTPHHPLSFTQPKTLTLIFPSIYRSPCCSRSRHPPWQPSPSRTTSSALQPLTIIATRASSVAPSSSSSTTTQNGIPLRLLRASFFLHHHVAEKLHDFTIFAPRRNAAIVRNAATTAAVSVRACISHHGAPPRRLLCASRGHHHDSTTFASLYLIQATSNHQQPPYQCAPVPTPTSIMEHASMEYAPALHSLITPGSPWLHHRLRSTCCQCNNPKEYY